MKIILKHSITQLFIIFLSWQSFAHGFLPGEHDFYRPHSIKRVNNIAYCKTDTGNVKLDIAWPIDVDKPTPAIVFIHGGFWMGGSKTQFTNAIEIAAKNGFAAITINYRLSSPFFAFKNLFPAALTDAKCSVRWLRANAHKYNINPHKIGAAGFSAGGNLALMIGNTEGQFEGNGGHQNQSSIVKAIVNMSGPTNMKKGVEIAATQRDFKTRQLLYHTMLRYTGFTVVADKNAASPTPFEKVSPTTYIPFNEFVPPVLSMYGDKDPIAGPIAGELLDESMKRAFATHIVKIYEGAEHAFIFEEQWRDEIMGNLLKFFDRRL
ncbi:MAG: alpha/beta hydrolase [Bacteriovoracaceae bacterium]|nr:alpha/beta hydrolase [Bacteriovoracaceae bacterium]